MSMSFHEQVQFSKSVIEANSSNNKQEESEETDSED